ncbi:hypothetical protein JVU11DRAFT_5153 [Chiua virens]|nr:hypothetical protein JVU11DRAFT_5153 [Chiua virens]
MSLPLCMRTDDPAAADPARRRLLHNLVSLPILSEPDTPTHDDIRIDDSHLPHLPYDENLYRWAVLYENQRGITLFSTPFYSALSLLPSDPHPFTHPQSYTFHANNPNLSLRNYPLPDGTWRWVSTAWMIDMHSDLGEVQHDGFEYNWFFRDNHWHAKVGKLSTGAWVRRRTLGQTHDASPPIVRIPLTSPPILTCPYPSSITMAYHLWDGSEQDWQHVHRLLRQLGRDGRKLELWRMWLAPYPQTHTSDFQEKSMQFDPPSSSSRKKLENRLSDIIPEGNPPPLAHLIAILRNHGEAILHSFVFPDSRAQFVHHVRQAGRLQDLENGLGRAFSVADVDFWSYTDNLRDLEHRE